MSISKRRRFEVFKRDRFTCRYCGHRAPNVALEVEHVYPRSLGGSDGIENLVTACESCNAGKADKMLSEDELRCMSDEVPTLIRQIAAFAIDDEDVARRLVELSTGYRPLVEWTDELWGLLGELHFEVSSGERSKAVG